MSPGSPKPLRATLAPSAASARAIPRPIPLVEPVTNAVRPRSPPLALDTDAPQRGDDNRTECSVDASNAANMYARQELARTFSMFSRDFSIPARVLLRHRSRRTNG